MLKSTVKKFLSFIFSGAVILIISNNFLETFPYKNMDYPYQTAYFENKLAVFRGHLKNVLLAGYCATDYSENIDTTGKNFWRNYEQIKAALAPTILDLYRPFSHSYVILYADKPLDIHQFLKHRPYLNLVDQVDHHIFLMQCLPI